MNPKTLKDLLLSLHGSSQVTVDLKIDVTPKCTKASRTTGLSLKETFGHESITQLSRRYGTCGLHYDIGINNRLKKEGNPNTFTVESRSWGERIGKSFLIQHKDQTYLEMFYENKNSPAGRVKYLFEDGTELSPEQIYILEKDFLPKHHGSRKQQALGIQKEVAVNNIKLSNLVRFSGYGVTIGTPQDLD